MSILILWIWSLAGVIDRSPVRGLEVRVVVDKGEASIVEGYEPVERAGVRGQ
jgi:hypothetical protein